MGGNELSIGIVFLAGAASFLSPCVLPIIPAYLTLISGMTFEELETSEAVQRARWRLFASALAFILGFSVVTVLMLGAMASLVAMAGDRWLEIIRWVGGVVIMVFALHIMGVFRIKAFFAEKRFHLTSNRFGIPGAALIGAAFGFGWTPCIGPILGSVLLYASGTASPAQVWWMLGAYSLGLAVPFLLAAVFVNLFLGVLRKLTRHLRTVEIVTGVLLLVMGVLLVTNQLAVLSAFAGRFFDLSQSVEGWFK